MQSSDRTVLVVEDDEDLQFILRVTLESVGHDVMAVMTAEDARPLLAEADLVLLDVRLPGISGLDLLAELDLAEGLPPIVVMSAHADRRIADEALQLGAVGFLPKPFEPMELAAAVDGWLSDSAT